MKKILFLGLLLIITIIPINSYAINEVNIYFFNSNSCDVCSQEKIYLEALKQRYPNIRVYSYEVSSPNNSELMNQAKNMFGITETGVPFTVVGDSAYLGFSQSKKAIFQKRVYEYSLNSYENRLGKKLGISYRNDLEGTVEEYKENSDYKIEETSGIVHEPTKSKSNYDKYNISFCLIMAGVDLGLIYLIVHLLEKRGRK